MTLRVRISGRAASQIRQAAQWWADNRSLAPGAFREDLSDAFSLLAQQPAIGSPYESVRTKGVRRLLVGRIRYFIYYRASSESLDILAVWHTSRGQNPDL